MNINLESKINNDIYTEYVYETFDIQNKDETSVSIPMNLKPVEDKEWEIGLILGGSGSGKTTILKKMGNIQDCLFDKKLALISNFDFLNPIEACELLCSMGLASVPTWLRPFHLLSNGEQYRAKLAYLVGSIKDGETLLIDEFTSVVDRNVAKSMSCALQKYIRKEGKKIVLASCHYDIIEWLNPNWVYSPMNGKLEFRRLARRPNIKLSVIRVESSAWGMFKKHHYLTETIPTGMCFVFKWDDVVVSFVSFSPLPSGTVKNAVRLSRSVVLPEFQGLGIGSMTTDFISQIAKNKGHRIYTKTINPRLGKYRENSERWKPTSKNGKLLKGQSKEKGENTWTTKRRPSYCYEYIGDGLKGYEHLLKPIAEMRNTKQTILNLQ